MPDPSDTPPPAADHSHPLLAAIQDWAQHALPAPPSGHPGPECQWCPLCQLASVLRGEHPELTERMAEAAAAVANAMKALAESAAARSGAGQAVGDDPGSRDPGADTSAAGKQPPRPRVQHIRLDDEAD